MAGKEVIADKIKDCVDALYSEDQYLFELKVCERCLMFRLAHYLQNEFDDYFVDCEFNKMGFEGHKSQSKVEPTADEGKLKNMFVDIIIHKRNSRTMGNIACIELKRTKRYMENDIERLKNMTRKGGFRFEGKDYIYGYDFGFFIYFPKDKNKSEIRLFENGEEITQNI